MPIGEPSAVLKNFAGLKILVVGLAREGSAAARFLANHGAQVTITDAKPADQLTGQIAALQDLAVSFHLGTHPTDLLSADKTDLLVVSPGVPLTAPFLQLAQSRGLPLTTESRLFCQLCPAPIIGISGSSGKTTTTTLVGLMLEASGYTTHVGGNIGRPLINKLNTIQPQDRVVLELSSFQLEYFHSSSVAKETVSPAIRPLLCGWSPAIGAILNITPNHLDRHDTMEAYTQAKRSLISYMDRGQMAVLGFDNPITHELGHDLQADVRWFSQTQVVERGACLIREQLTLTNAEGARAICPVETIKLRGSHNVYNVLAACAIAEAAGAEVEAMATVAASFTGVRHRLELVAQQNGVTYYNDSIATSPERLIAAINAFAEPLILLAGGQDKGLPWDEAARLILAQTRHIILFGQAAALIETALQRQEYAGSRAQTHRRSTLSDAVALAKQLAQPNDAVILSPGCTSFDAYADFEARGDHFKRLVLDN